jgi:hypothetical protein
MRKNTHTEEICMAKPIFTDELTLHQDQFQVVDVRCPVFDASPQMIPGAAWKNPEDIDSWGAQLGQAGQ